jgi:hypothetical protein
MLHVGFLFGLLFNPEDGGREMFLRNVGWLLTDCTHYIPEDRSLRNHRCENFKSYLEKLWFKWSAKLLVYKRSRRSQPKEIYLRNAEDTQSMRVFSPVTSCVINLNPSSCGPALGTMKADEAINIPHNAGLLLTEKIQGWPTKPRRILYC